MQPGAGFVCALALAALAVAGEAAPDCTKGDEYFDRGPDSRKYVHCRAGELLFKECARGEVWSQARGGCERSGGQQAEESEQAAELSIVPADWRSVHGWCWGWPILHVTPVVVYRYRWVTGWHSGWYGRHYCAVALSEGGGENAGDSDEAQGDEQQAGDHHAKEEQH